MMSNKKNPPRIVVGFADKVIEDDVVLRVRPMGLHAFGGGCLFAIIPTLIFAGFGTLGVWLFDAPWAEVLLLSSCVFVAYVLLYRLWDCRRRKGRHDLLIDKVERRIYLRDSKSQKRVYFDFGQVERLSDTHSHFMGTLIEEIQFDLRSECDIDSDPPIAGFLKANSHPMSMWCPNRVESGRFGDVLAELIGCPIIHHE